MSFRELRCLQGCHRFSTVMTYCFVQWPCQVKLRPGLVDILISGTYNLYDTPCEISIPIISRLKPTWKYGRPSLKNLRFVCVGLYVGLYACLYISAFVTYVYVHLWVCTCVCVGKPVGSMQLLVTYTYNSWHFLIGLRCYTFQQRHFSSFIHKTIFFFC